MYRRIDVKHLIDESKINSNVLTIEATVITGFEGAALDECKEKCSPLIITKAQGRIFFNISLQNFEKVLQLRSVDNLFLVNDALSSLELKKNKEEDLEVIKSLVNKVNWDPTLTTWAKLINFEGVLFPLNIKDSNNETINEALQGNEDESNGNINEIEQEKEGKESSGMEDLKNISDIQMKSNREMKTDEESNANIVDEMAKLDLDVKSKENVSKIDQLNISCFPQEKKHTRKVSESSEEMYFSAEEEGSQAAESKSPQKQDSIMEEVTNKTVSDNNILKFRATCNRVGDHSFTSMEAAACFGGALNDKFNWTVDLTNFDLNVILNINKDFSYICSAITDKSMHRRNITHFGNVTLRSTMCYNLVRLAEPIRGEIIVDPLCGGGSIPIEGALGFPSTYHICGDNNDKAMKRTQANVNHLNQEHQMKVDPLKWTARRLPLRDSVVDVCVTDLPFGRRSGKRADNFPLYQDVLLEMARVSRCGAARAVLLTHDKRAFIKAMSGRNSEYWRQIRTLTVNQGGLNSTVFLLLRTAKAFLH